MYVKIQFGAKAKLAVSPSRSQCVCCACCAPFRDLRRTNVHSATSPRDRTGSRRLCALVSAEIMVCSKCEKKLSKVCSHSCFCPPSVTCITCTRLHGVFLQIVVPDKWKAGARNVTGGKHGGRKVGGAGKARSSVTTRKKHRCVPCGAPSRRCVLRCVFSFSCCGPRPNPLARPCRICKCKVHQAGAHYCNDCAYQKGICSMCGRKHVATKGYKMST